MHRLGCQVKQEVLENAVKSMCLPGRFEDEHGGKHWVFDVAHNSESFLHLSKVLSRKKLSLH